MNRIDRVTSILIQLQSKKIIPAKEIAQRFVINFLMTNDKLWYNASMSCLVCAMKRRLNHGNDKETILRFG